MIHDVDIVPVPAQPVLSLRARGPVAEIGTRMRRLRELAAEAGLETSGPMTARIYDVAGPGTDVDHDVCSVVHPRDDGSVPDCVGEAGGEWLPLHHILEAVHHGPHDEIADAWAAVHEAAGAPRGHAGGPRDRGLRTQPFRRGRAGRLRHPHPLPYAR